MKEENQSQKGFCEIRVKTKLEPHWAEWFDAMKFETEPDTTIISGLISDQAALQGLMEKIRMLGLTIISIKYDGQQLSEKSRTL